MNYGDWLNNPCQTNGIILRLACQAWIFHPLQLTSAGPPAAGRLQSQSNITFAITTIGCKQPDNLRLLEDGVGRKSHSFEHHSNNNKSFRRAPIPTNQVTTA